MSLIIVIGRGHGGTRIMSHTLSESGVYMGETLNNAGDLIPPEDMYEACRVFARRVHWKGSLDWDWSGTFSVEIPQEFVELIESYLSSVLSRVGENRGWKIPETNLCFPWISRMYPDAKYIYWMRDPRDNIAGGHKTDDLRDFGIEYPPTEDISRRRAISWIYQYELVQASPKPKHWIEVRFEDFVLQQEATLERLEEYLGFELARIPVSSDPIGRWEREGVTSYPFLEPAIRAYGYEKN